MNISLHSLHLSTKASISPLFSLAIRSSLFLAHCSFNKMLSPIIYSNSLYNSFAIQHFYISKIVSASAIAVVDTAYCEIIKPSLSKPIIVEREQGYTCGYIEDGIIERVVGAEAPVYSDIIDYPFVFNRVQINHCSCNKAGAIYFIGALIEINTLTIRNCSATNSTNEFISGGILFDSVINQYALSGIIITDSKSENGTHLLNIRNSTLTFSSFTGSIATGDKNMFPNDIPMIKISGSNSIIFNTSFIIPQKDGDTSVGINIESTNLVTIKQSLFHNFSKFSITMDSNSYLALNQVCFSHGIDESVNVTEGQLKIRVSTIQVFSSDESACHFTPTSTPELSKTEKGYAISTVVVFVAIFVIVAITMLVMVFKKAGAEPTFKFSNIVEVSEDSGFEEDSLTD